MKNMLLLLVIVLLSTACLFAQDPAEGVVQVGDTLYVPNTFNGNPINALNEWILWDHDGDVANEPKHTVYKLYRGLKYGLSAKIDLNRRLTLVADKPGATAELAPPMIGGMLDLEGNFPSVSLIDTHGPVTLKHLYITGYPVAESANWSKFLVRVNGDEFTNHVDGCFFEYAGRFCMRTQKGLWNSWIITNTFAKNGSIQSKYNWQGHFIGFNNNPADSVVIQNCTFMNSHGFFMKIRKNNCNYTLIDHNTIINEQHYPLFFTDWTNATVSNNIFYNAHSFGESYYDKASQELDFYNYSIVNVDTLNGKDVQLADTTWYEDEKRFTRKLHVLNNYYGMSQEVLDYWSWGATEWVWDPDSAIAGSAMEAGLWMNDRTKEFFDSDQYPNIKEEGTFFKDNVGEPQFVNVGDHQLFADALKALRTGDDLPAIFGWDPNIDPYTPNAVLDWPPYEDLRIMNSQLVGTDGLPLGDLNWYEEYAERWDMTGWGRSHTWSAVKDNTVVPALFALNQNYPNPFNPVTSINYQLDRAADVDLAVFNLLGEKVKTLASGRQNAGNYTVQWDGTNEMGIPVASGLYLYTLKSGANTQSMKMMMMK